MIDSDRWWIGSDNDARIEGLRDTRSEAPVNTATVTATLYTAAGLIVSGCSAVAIPYSANSNGDYVGTAIPASAALAEGSTYTLVILVVVGGVQVARYQIRRAAAYLGPQKRS